MTFQLGNELKEIRNAPEDVRAERLASAFRRVCKDITWNTRAKFNEKLHATPTAMVSPITTNQETGNPVFTLTAVKSGETLKINYGADGITLRSSTGVTGLFQAKRNGNTTWLAERMEKAVTNWLKKQAPGQPRSADFDSPKL